MVASLVERFQRTLTVSDITRSRVEAQFQKGKLVLRDVEIVYEGLFLRAVVNFEDLLESVFFEVLNGRSGRSAWHPLVSGRPAKIRDCVFGDKAYLTWLPYANCLRRAQLYLKGGLPFSLFDETEQLKLSKIVIIRNAIAHSSKHAIKSFHKKVIGETALPARERRPSAYLRGTSSGSLTRYQVYVQSLGGMAQRLS